MSSRIDVNPIKENHVSSLLNTVFIRFKSLNLKSIRQFVILLVYVSSKNAYLTYINQNYLNIHLRNPPEALNLQLIPYVGPTFILTHVFFWPTNPPLTMNSKTWPSEASNYANSTIRKVNTTILNVFHTKMINNRLESHIRTRCYPYEYIRKSFQGQRNRRQRYSTLFSTQMARNRLTNNICTSFHPLSINASPLDRTQRVTNSTDSLWTWNPHTY